MHSTVVAFAHLIMPALVQITALEIFLREKLTVVAVFIDSHRVLLKASEQCKKLATKSKIMYFYNTFKALKLTPTGSLLCSDDAQNKFENLALNVFKNKSLTYATNQTCLLANLNKQDNWIEKESLVQLYCHQREHRA